MFARRMIGAAPLASRVLRVAARRLGTAAAATPLRTALLATRKPATATGLRAAMSTAAPAPTRPLSALLTTPLESLDPELFDIVEQEKRRQRDSLALIPSENFTSSAVLEALGSIMQNKYSEGYPGARYYGGNEFIDQSERLCQDRALAAFGLDPKQWGVNVQPLSGSPANFEVYTALLQPHDRLMALDLPHGGHLSHGYQLPTKKISAVSTYFECLPYRLNEATGRIDYDGLEALALRYRPKLLISGASAYPRHIDYARLRKIADAVGCHFMMDMAHISGLIAGKALPSPFPFADVVTTTTHKSLRGPRGAMIFYRKGVRSVDAKTGKATEYDLEARINAAVFPGHQGGPHNHTIAALAVALKQAQAPEYAAYQAQVIKNCAHLAATLTAKGYALVSGGTDNHLILVDVRPHGLDGAKVERVCELANIAINKNTVPGDKSALQPGGIRLGTPALTTRGLLEADFGADGVAGFLDRAVQIAVAAQKAAGSTKIKDFRVAVDAKTGPVAESIAKLRADVVAFARRFEPVGFKPDAMRYKA